MHAMVFSRGRSDGGGAGRDAGSGKGLSGPAPAVGQKRDWVCCGKQCAKDVGKEFVNFGWRMACHHCGGSKAVCFGRYAEKGSEPKGAGAPTFAEQQTRRAANERKKQAKRPDQSGKAESGSASGGGKHDKPDAGELARAHKRIKELEDAVAAKSDDADGASGDVEIDGSSASEAKERRAQIEVVKEKIKAVEGMSEAAGSQIFGSGPLWEEQKCAARRELDALFTANREAKPIDTQLAASKKWHTRKKELHTKAAEREKDAH